VRLPLLALPVLALVPAPVRATPPTACVDPLADARALLAPTTPRDLRTSRIVDLDGDGRRDWLVWDQASCGSGGCDFHVYVTGHGCARWAGWLRGRAVTPLRTRHAGVRDLTATETGGALSWTDARAEHDGRIYRIQERDCTLTAGEDAPRCAAWHPRMP
jgi:hypothetical protein